MAGNQEQPEAENGRRPRLNLPRLTPFQWTPLTPLPRLPPLSDVIQSHLEPVRQMQADLQRDVADLRQELQQGQATIRGDLAAVQADFLREIQKLRDEISRQSVFLVFPLYTRVYEVINSVTALREKNNIARVINSGASRNSTALEPFYGVNGELVPDFPETFGDAKALDGKYLGLIL